MPLKYARGNASFNGSIMFFYRCGSVLAALLLGATLAACGGTVTKRASLAPEVVESDYTAQRSALGVVLLAVNWGRRWNCGGFQHAELRGFAFDRLPWGGRPPAAAGDMEAEGPEAVLMRPGLQHYALQLPPGSYALSRVRIRATRDTAPLALDLSRSELAQDGAPAGGSFQVGAGETVYIGNFALNCEPAPMLWRYYTQGRENFQHQLLEYRRKYPFLKLDEVHYRLFDTSRFGQPYQLP